MTLTKNISKRNKEAIKLIESSDVLDSYALASEGKYFPKATEKSSTRGDVVAILKVRLSNGNYRPYWNTKRDLMTLIQKAIRDGEVNAYDVYGEDTCDKCHGVGKIDGYSHVHGGVCFKCGGFGQA